MKNRQQRNPRRDIRQHSFSMAVDHAIDVRKPLEQLAMDESLGIPLLGFRIYSRAVADVVLDQVGWRRDDAGGHITTHDVDVRILGVPDRDVAVCVDDIVVVQDVVCCD
jgi:hypothetical protein